MSVATPNTDGARGTSASPLDAVIVGAGFGGCYFLHLLRKRGMSVKLIDALDGFGGTWRANCYPGARVDSEMPYYLFSDPDLLKGWTWTERYAGGDELRRYFDYVDRSWKLSEDAYLSTRVTEARYDDGSRLWHIKTDRGQELVCRYFLPCTGTSHKQVIPDFPGMSAFKGEIYHPAAWPREDPTGVMRGKRVAVIGSGASAVQIVQEAAKTASHLVEFIRTPNYAMPMQQKSYGPEEVDRIREKVPEMMKIVRSSAGAVPYHGEDRKTMDATPEEREAIWDRNFEYGGFRCSAGAFNDWLTDETANRLAYDYWARRTRARIPDPAKRDILAPLEPPVPLGSKRSCLEQDYYEMCSLPHVTITDSRIERFDETGIVTADGAHHDLDVVAVATGYDAVTGTYDNLNIHGRGGLSLRRKWREEGVRTQLGMSVHGFPNMFFVYGPQAPTAFTAGTPFIERQVEWVAAAIALAERSAWSAVEATAQAEQAWTALNHHIAAMTLFPKADSWYMGSNVPGKRRELLIFAGGQALYFDSCDRSLQNGLDGFHCTADPPLQDDR